MSLLYNCEVLTPVSALYRQALDIAGEIKNRNLEADIDQVFSY